MGIVTFLKQTLPKHFKEQLAERGINETGSVVKDTHDTRSDAVKKAFDRYGVSKGTKNESNTFNYDMLVEEIQKETHHSEEVILRAMTMDMHKLPVKYIESILSVMDNDFGNWFDAREFDDEYEG